MRDFDKNSRAIVNRVFNPVHEERVKTRSAPVGIAYCYCSFRNKCMLRIYTRVNFSKSPWVRARSGWAELIQLLQMTSQRFFGNPAGVALIPDQLIGFMYSAEYGTPGNSLADFYQLGFNVPNEGYNAGFKLGEAFGMAISIKHRILRMSA